MRTAKPYCPLDRHAIVPRYSQREPCAALLAVIPSPCGWLTPRQPCPRYLVGPTVVEHRHNLLFEQIVDCAALDVVLISQIGILFAGPDRPAVVVLIAFDPPPVKHAEIEPAIHADFHAAGAGSFERPSRIIEPDVDSLNEMTRDVHVIVFEEYDVIAQF